MANELGKFDIKPSDIDATRHPYSTFGEYEAGQDARAIVTYLQASGDEWRPFAKDHVENLLGTHIRLGELIRKGFVVNHSLKELSVTNDFIYTYWSRFPAKGR